MLSKKEPERKRLHIVCVHLYEMPQQAKLIGSVELRIWLPTEQGGNVRKEVRRGLLSTVTLLFQVGWPVLNIKFMICVLLCTYVSIRYFEKYSSPSDCLMEKNLSWALACLMRPLDWLIFC